MKTPTDFFPAQTPRPILKSPIQNISKSGRKQSKTPLNKSKTGREKSYRRPVFGSDGCSKMTYLEIKANNSQLPV
jgi:hypothetical protein